VERVSLIVTRLRQPLPEVLTCCEPTPVADLKRNRLHKVAPEYLESEFFISLFLQFLRFTR